ncbi:MAG TPA: ATP-binding cassette domain-containing protein [Casimicrobiaceae bacterium]|nr:ATP-binding cassette domain-containing protein [Casimicrobiaceae bacterium]
MVNLASQTTSPIVRIAAIDKWYGQFHALHSVDVTVMPGECVVLWGPSGSGKTTLLRCIAGLEPIQSGTMEIAGVRAAVGPLVRPTPSRAVGMVFQRSALFLNMRVIDNLTIGLRRVRRLERREAEALALRHLAQVRMAEFAMRYPAQLSGGQQQRVEIARALCMEPHIILFDEPTAALDPELKHEVGEAIAALAREGRTVIVATHEPLLVHALRARMVLMANGAVIGESTSADFFAPR